METLLILAAVAVAVLALAIVSALSSREPRQPLRTRQEEELGDGDPLDLIRTLDRAYPSSRRETSPIDRAAQILDLEAIETELGRPRDDAPKRVADGRAAEARPREETRISQDLPQDRPEKRSDTEMDHDLFDDPHRPDGPARPPGYRDR